MTVPRARVGLSTASVYPESTAAAFELAARLGYDGVEIMVWTDPVSQDPEALRRLSDHHAVPILAIHAPCLLITQRVWGTEPWVKLERARAAAEKLGAKTVVVHPPFRWQRDYARGFRQRHRPVGRGDRHPLRGGEHVPAAGTRPGGRRRTRRTGTRPSSRTGRTRWTCRTPRCRQSDPIELAATMGHRLAHVHIADGTGLAKDEHLVPGRGGQPCADLLERLARTASPARSSSRSTPAAPPTGPSGRPTWPRRWRTRGCTWWRPRRP